MPINPDLTISEFKGEIRKIEKALNAAIAEAVPKVIMPLEVELVELEIDINEVSVKDDGYRTYEIGPAKIRGGLEF